LGYGDIPIELDYACEATLISDQYLLTAGHCVRTKRLNHSTQNADVKSHTRPGHIYFVQLAMALISKPFGLKHQNLCFTLLEPYFTENQSCTPRNLQAH